MGIADMHKNYRRQDSNPGCMGHDDAVAFVLPHERHASTSLYCRTGWHVFRMEVQMPLHTTSSSQHMTRASGLSPHVGNPIFDYSVYGNYFDVFTEQYVHMYTKFRLDRMLCQ